MAGEVRQPIDITSLGRYVKDIDIGIQPPLTYKQFGVGQSNPTYQLTDAAGQKYVLRKKPPGQLMSSKAHQVEREFRILKALEDTDVPVPKVHVLCDDPAVIGSPFYIMEFLDGRQIQEPDLPGVSPKERLLIWRDVIRTLVKMHRLDYIKIGLGELGRHHGFYTRQIKTFDEISKTQEKIVDVDTKEPVSAVPHIQEMVTFFAHNQPADRSSLVHGDFKMDNILLHKTEPRVIGVLDWEMATIGHPLSDFVSVTIHLPRNDPLSPPLYDSSLVPVPRLPLLEQCVSWYAESEYQIRADIAWGSAFSGFRGCVIMQGIAARVAQRQASGANAKYYVDGMRPLAERTWKYIQELKAKKMIKPSL